jgi:hypothetical protein
VLTLDLGGTLRKSKVTPLPNRTAMNGGVDTGSEVVQDLGQELRRSIPAPGPHDQMVELDGIAPLPCCQVAAPLPPLRFRPSGNHI